MDLCHVQFCMVDIFHYTSLRFIHAVIHISSFFHFIVQNMSLASHALFPLLILQQMNIQFVFIFYLLIGNKIDVHIWDVLCIYIYLLQYAHEYLCLHLSISCKDISHKDIQKH